MQRAQTQKGKHQWKPQQPSVKTGGVNYSGFSVAKNTLPGSSAPAGWGGAGNQPMGMQSYAGQVRAYWLTGIDPIEQERLFRMV